MKMAEFVEKMNNIAKEYGDIEVGVIGFDFLHEDTWAGLEFGIEILSYNEYPVVLLRNTSSNPYFEDFDDPESRGNEEFVDWDDEEFAEWDNEEEWV